MTTAVMHPAVQARVSKWLGVLPSGWSGARLCQVAEAWTSNVDKHTVEGQPEVRLCNYTDVYKNESITSDLDFMEATATPEQIARFRIRRGDTIITKDSETADDIGIPAYVEYEADDLICGYHLAIVRPDPRAIAPRFLYWVMASGAVLGQWRVLASGVTRVGLRSTDLTKATIPLPPAGEQRAIADFLDSETAQIDALIAKQNALIDVLRERRSAVREAFARHALVGNRLKWRLSEVDERAGDRADALPLMSVSIDWGVRRRDEITSDPPRAEDLSKYKVCAAGDIVVNRMRAFQGALGVAPTAGIVSPDYAVLRAAAGTSSAWLSEVMRTRTFVGEIVLRLRGIGTTGSGAVRTPRINVNDLLDIRVAETSNGDQLSELADYGKQTAKIDALIAKVQQHIALAQERRAALITEAVTGQIDVARGVQPDG
ncbi:restriction endonuclease subunit S [Streptomyces sp. S1A]|uniref:restriction endonuclease subunit S n=1 Tax=Streptomyces sp. ICN903 TaxID=2964654 RepID=UPI001EDAF2C6|nr:restriction endonuclease subunit S [Streptomyces sp. ICN903]MCG3040984.1 restriction endonuclease subunit S [Streptomyces sp. ICN903]